MINKIFAKFRLDKNFLKSSFVVFIGSFLVSILNYLFKTFSGRLLGPIDYGVISFLVSIVMFFTVFSVSIDNVVTKFISEAIAKKEEGKINFIYRTLTKYAIYMGAIVAIIVLLMSNKIGLWFKIDPAYVKYLSAIFLFIFANNVAKGVLRGKQEFPKFVGLNILEALSKLILLFAFFYLGLKVNSAVFGLVGSSAILFMATVVILRKYRQKNDNKIELKTLYKYFSNTFLALGFFSVLAFIDIPLAKYFLSEIDAGYYAALSDMGKIIFYAITPIILVMFPIISEYHTKGKKHFFLLAQTVGLILLLGTPALIIYYYFPSQIVNLLYGEKFLVVSPYLAKIGLAMLILVLCNMFTQYFLSIKKTRFAWFIITTLILEIILFYLFHQNIGQIISDLMFSFSTLLFLFIIYYLYNKKETIRQYVLESSQAD